MNTNKSILSDFISDKFFWIILLIAVLVSSLSYYKNSQLAENNRAEEIKAISEWLQKQDAASLHVLGDVEIVDIKNQFVPMNSIVEREKRLGLYINRMYCSDCWKSIARNLAYESRRLGIDEPFIISEGFNIRDLRLMSREDSLSLPIFLLMKVESTVFQDLASQGEPFLFYLHRNGSISSILYFDDVMQPAILKYIENSFNCKQKIDTLLIHNPVIDLGRIPMRSTFSLKYKVENLTSDTIHVSRIKPSCSCMQVNSTTYTLPPYSSDNIIVGFHSNGLGEFEDKILVYTSERTAPYILTLKGICE